MNLAIATALRSKCCPAILIVYLAIGSACTTGMAQTGDGHNAHPGSEATVKSSAPGRESDNKWSAHPDGDDKWKTWGIDPRVLSARERFERRSLLTGLFGPKSEVAEDVFLELKGERPIDKARPLLDILGLDSLANTPKRVPLRLSDSEIRSVEGFVVSSELEKRPHDLNPDRVAFTHEITAERARVHIAYANSNAEAICCLIRSSHRMFSAPLGDVLPTCRIARGPGDFCWLGWSRTNEDRTSFFPSDADILFVRNGTAVLLFTEDPAKHDAMMELARTLDALVVGIAKNERRKAARDSQ